MSGSQLGSELGEVRRSACWTGEALARRVVQWVKPTPCLHASSMSPGTEKALTGVI